MTLKQIGDFYNMAAKPTLSSRAMARPNAGGRPRLCVDQSFGLDFWLPFDQAKGRRTSIIA